MQPPDSTTDFEADALAAEQEQAMEHRAAEARAEAFRPDDHDVIDVDTGGQIVDVEAERLALKRQQLQLQMAELEAERKSVERRRVTPQVIDSSGELVDPAEPPEPVWTGLVVEIQGKQVQVKQPSAAAIRYLSIFATGDAGQRRGDFQDFMHRHVSTKSTLDIKEWTYASEITEDFYDQLIKKLVTLGTNRPTGPSSASQRSR